MSRLIILLLFILGCKQKLAENRIHRRLLCDDYGIKTYNLDSGHYSNALLITDEQIELIISGNEFDGYFLEVKHNGFYRKINLKAEGYTNVKPEFRKFTDDHVVVGLIEEGKADREVHIPYHLIDIEKDANRMTRNVNSVQPKAIHSSEFSSYHFWSNNLGLKDHFRVELELKQVDSELYMNIQLFKRINNCWILIQELNKLFEAVSAPDPQISDYNNDGYNDLTFVSATAARGANEVRSLYIFNPESEQLNYIINSDHYPNLRYNSTMNCIDAQSFYNGSTTHFLHIRNNRLEPSMEVSLMNHSMNVIVYDSTGNKKYLVKDKPVDPLKWDDYHRFTRVNFP